MKEKINLEIIENNNRLLINKNKTELANLEYKKNQLIYFNNLKKHKTFLKEKKELEEKKITSEYNLDSEIFDLKLVTNNNSFITNHKKGINMLGNNTWLNLENTTFLTPFSGIKNINNTTFKSEFDIKFEWRTIGNNTSFTGPIVWDENNKIIYSKNNYNDGVKKISKVLPKKDTFININSRKYKKSNVFINNKVYNDNWVNWGEFQLNFWGNPIKENLNYGNGYMEHTTYYNHTNNIITIIIKKNNRGQYEIWKWLTDLTKRKINNNNYKLILKPNENFCIKYNGSIDLNLTIDNVEVQPNKEYISKWYNIDIPKNHYFSFNVHENLGYKFKINFNEKIYNSHIFLNDYKNLMEMQLNKISIIKEDNIKTKNQFDKSRILLEEFKLKDSILTEKENILSLYQKISDEYYYIKQKNNLLHNELDITKAKDILNYIITSFYIFKNTYKEYKPVEFNRLDVYSEDQDRINEYRFELQDMFYKSEIIYSKMVDANIKELLLPNWKNKIQENFNNIKINKELIVNKCEEVNRLKTNVYSEKEWRDNISNTFKYYKYCVDAFDIIKKKYNDSIYFKNYFLNNNVNDTFIFNKINDGELYYYESKKRIDNLYGAFKSFQKTADEIRDEEIAKINNNYTIMENHINDISNNVKSLIDQHNETKKINKSNIQDISQISLDLQKKEDDIQNLSNKNIIENKDITSAKDIRKYIQNNILLVNEKSSENIKANDKYKNKLNEVKKIYNSLNTKINSTNNKIKNINNTNTNQQIKNHYQIKLVDINNLLKKSIDLSNNINTIESSYTIPLINNNENNTRIIFQNILNIGKASNTYFNIINSKLLLQNTIDQNKKCQTFAIYTIDYINNSSINFFEKIQQTKNNIMSLDIECKKSNTLLKESKLFISQSQNETTCIINDINKIRYLLNKINLQYQENTKMEETLIITDKLYKQITTLQRGLDAQKKELDNIGKTNIIKQNITFGIDEIIVPNTNQTKFRNYNTINDKIKSRNITFSSLRTVNNNILYNISDTQYDDYVMRYVYWGESTLIPNIDHAPMNPTIPNNDNDIGLLSFRHMILNKTPYLKFYNTSDTPPYNENTSINKGYFFKGDQQNGVWNLQNSIVDPSYGNITSMDWLKIDKFQSVNLYKDVSGSGQHNMGYFIVYENNDKTSNRLGNNIHKTTRFSNFEYGSLSTTTLGNQGPRQIALRSHAALLGWLGSEEKNRMKKYIDDKILSSLNNYISKPVDFNYSNCDGMFVMLNVNKNNILWKDASDNDLFTNGVNFIPEHKDGLIFVTIENIIKTDGVNSKITAYKNMTNDLSFNSKTLNDHKLYEFVYKHYYTLPLIPDPVRRSDGAYYYNNYEYTKTSGPDKDGKYILNERNTIDNTDFEITLSPYNFERNKTKLFPYYTDDDLSNIYKYTNNQALVNKKYNKGDIRINDVCGNILFTEETNIIEIRNLNPYTLEYDESNLDNGLVERYIYVGFTSWNSTIVQGKYHKITNWERLEKTSKEMIYITNNISDVGINIAIVNDLTIISKKNIETIKIQKLLIEKKQLDSQYRKGSYLIQDISFNNNITGNDNKEMKMVVDNNSIKFYKILNDDFDVGSLSLTYTYINKPDYWKYYKTLDKDFNLFSTTNNKPYNALVHKIRIESNELSPLEICNIDVFTALNFDTNDNPIAPLFKYNPPNSTDVYKFKNPQQSTTSNELYNALKAVNGNSDFDNYSQTEIEFNNKLKWFEVELDPPARITSIHFQARKNKKYNDRINNAKIFLIDKYGEKINWEWRQITPIPNSIKYEIDFDISNNQGNWVNGKSAILKGDSGADYQERVSRFSRIKTIQDFDYYPQEYFVMNNENLIHRFGDKKNIIEYNNNNNILEWEPLFKFKQEQKENAIREYNSGLVPYGFYIMTNSNWNYDWVLNNTFGMEFKKKDDNDILIIYSLENIYEKKAKKFTYYYNPKDKTFNLNADIEADMFFWKHSKIKNETFKLYENRIELLDGRKTNITNFISNNRIIESLSVYKKKIDDIKKQTIVLRNNKRINNGNYLIETDDYSKYVQVSVNHPELKLYYLNSNLDISIDTDVKEIIIEGTFTNIVKNDIQIIDENNNTLKQEFYSLIPEVNQIEIYLEHTIKLYALKCSNNIKNILRDSKIKLLNKYQQIIPYKKDDIISEKKTWGNDNIVNINTIDYTSKIKTIKIDLIRTDVNFDHINLYDIDGYKIPSKNYTSNKTNNIYTLTLKAHQELTVIDTHNSSGIDLSGSKIFLYSNSNQKLDLMSGENFIVNDISKQTFNISIKIPDYKKHLDIFEWNEININNPNINDLKYISKKRNDSFQLFNYPQINYKKKDKMINLITFKNYTLERIRIKDLLYLKNKKLRKRLPGEDPAEFYVFENDSIPWINTNNNKKSIKIKKDGDKLYIIKIDNDLNEVDSNNIWYIYEWNNITNRYENAVRNDYITELHEPINYKTDTWVIITDSILNNTTEKAIRMNIKYFQTEVDILMLQKKQQEELDLQNRLSVQLPINNYIVRRLFSDNNIHYLEVLMDRITIKFYQADISILTGNNYKTLNKLNLLSQPYQEFKLVKDRASQNYNYVSYNSNNQKLDNNYTIYKKLANSSIGPAWTRNEIEAPKGEKNMGSWISLVYTKEQQKRLQIDENGNSLNRQDNFTLILKNNITNTTTEFTISDWEVEKFNIDNKFKSEYEALIEAQEELRIKKLKNELLALDKSLINNIGGDLINNIGNTQYQFNTINDIETFAKLLPNTIKTLPYNNLINIYKNVSMFNSKKKPGTQLYLSKGVELWKKDKELGKYRFIPSSKEIDINNIDNINFKMSNSNSLHFDNFKNNWELLGKEGDKKSNKVYTLLQDVLNKATRITYYMEYKSNEILFQLIQDIDNKLLINGDIRPNNADNVIELKNKIKKYNDIIKNHKDQIDHDTKFEQIEYSDRQLSIEYKNHQDNNGTIELASDIKIYMDKFKEIKQLLNVLELFKIYGPQDNGRYYWNFKSFIKDYDDLPRFINNYDLNTHLGPYPNEFIIGMNPTDIFNLFPENKNYLPYNNPFDITQINKINEIIIKENTNKDYKNKIKEYYDIFFNVRKWQIAIANKKLLDTLSPLKKWNSLNDVEKSISNLIDIKDITILTVFDLQNVDITLRNNAYNEHIKNNGTKILRNKIDLYYLKINQVITRIINVQKDTPIDVGTYMITNNKIYYKAIISKDYNIKINNINEFNKIIGTEEIFIRNNLNKNYVSVKNRVIDIVSFKDNIYSIKVNNEDYSLFKWPTFYSFGDNIVTMPIVKKEKEQFILNTESENYSNFYWWKNQQIRNMDMNLGTRLNSKNSVAKGAIKMPYLIYLRNNILLPMKGFNKRKINNNNITIFKDKKGIFSFTKNELLDKREQLIWWLNEWTKPLHYDVNENIVTENKLIDGTNIPSSQRWPNQYNTVRFFDQFIGKDTIQQWASFLKNTGWDDDVKRNITHKIIETSVYPILERVTRHMKEMIDLSIYLIDLHNLKQEYVKVANDFIFINSDQKTKLEKNIIIQKYKQNDIEIELKKNENNFLTKINDIKFDKLYKIIKKRLFNENNTIKITTKNGLFLNDNIINHMSKVVHGYNVFSEWKHYQEFGWRSYGHGTCGEWFNGAYDHPDINKKDNIKFNTHLKDFFTNTKRVFVTLQSITGVNYEIKDHLRLIDKSYADNYWFNDFKEVNRIIIKEQYLEIINIEEYQRSIREIQNNTLKNLNMNRDSINEFIEKNYNFVNNIVSEHKKFYLHDFSNNNVISTDFYNNSKIIVNFLSIPNRMVIMLKNDLSSNMTEPYIGIYENNVNDIDISNNVELAINESKNISKLKKKIKYSEKIKDIYEYNIPFTHFNDFQTNILKGTGSNFKLAVIVKKNGKKHIFAIANNIKPFKKTNKKFNIQNSYISWLNYKEKLQLLLPEAKNVVKFLNNQNSTDTTFINNKKNKFKDLITLELPSSIDKANNEYLLLYKSYELLNKNDIYSLYEWEKILGNLYNNDSLENKKNNSINQTKLLISNWEEMINNYNKEYNSYRNIYIKMKPILDKSDLITHNFIHLHNVSKDITLSNMNDNLIELNKESQLYQDFLLTANNLNKLYEHLYNFKSKKIEYIDTIKNNINIIKKYKNEITKGLEFPYALENAHPNDDITYFYKNKWTDELENEKDVINFQSYIKSIETDFDSILKLHTLINTNYSKIIDLKQKTKYQITDLNIFTKMIKDIDIIVMDSKNMEGPILKNSQIIDDEILIIDKEYERIKKKKSNFIQGDINTLNKLIINFNPKLLDLKNNIIIYDKFIIDSNKDISDNILFEDIILNNIEKEINNVKLTDLNTRSKYKKYFNKKILYSGFFKINNTRVVISTIKTKINTVETKLSNYLIENTKIKSKIEQDIQILLNSSDSYFNKNNKRIKIIEDEMKDTKLTYNTVINDLLFRLPTNTYDVVDNEKKKKIFTIYSNGNNLRMQNEINKENISFKFNIDDKIYSDVNKNKTFYKLEILSINWESYKLVLQKVENTIIDKLVLPIVKNEKTYFIINNDNQLYDKNISLLSDMINIIDINISSLSKNDVIMNTEFQNFIKNKNEINKYEWIIKDDTIKDIIQKDSLFNNIINKKEAIKLELELQNNQMMLFKLKMTMDKDKRTFFKNYKNIEKNTIIIKNPNDKNELLNLSKTIKIYQDLHDSIILSFNINTNINFYLNNIKSYINIEEYGVLNNYYNNIDNKVYINNDNEIKLCSELLSNEIIIKDAIIKNKKNIIDLSKVEIQNQIDLLQIFSNTNKNEGIELKRDINNKIQEINNLLKSVPITILANLSQKITDLEKSIRNSFVNKEKQNFLQQLIIEEKNINDNALLADSNYDKVVKIIDESNIKIKSYDKLINPLIESLSNININNKKIHNLFNVTDKTNDITNTITYLGNTKEEFQITINTLIETVTNYNEDLKDY